MIVMYNLSDDSDKNFLRAFLVCCIQMAGAWSRLPKVLPWT